MGCAAPPALIKNNDSGPAEARARERVVEAADAEPRPVRRPAQTTVIATRRRCNCGLTRA
jgi:hypothetical protein